MVIQHITVEWIGDFDWFPVQCIAPIVFWSLCNVFLLNFLQRGSHVTNIASFLATRIHAILLSYRKDFLVMRKLQF